MGYISIAPNSIVRRKEGAQEDEKEEVGDKRKVGPTETPTPGADASIGAICEEAV